MGSPVHPGCYRCGGECAGHVYDAATLIAATAWRETLAANLAAGGALCASFYEGFSAGFTSSGEGFNGEYAPRQTAENFRKMAQSTECGGAYEPTWKPGCGRAWGGGA